MDRKRLIQAARDGEVQARNALGQWLCTELIAFFSSRHGVAQRDELLQETMKDIMAKLVTHAPADPEEFLNWALSFAGTRARAARGQRLRARAREAKLRARVPTPPRLVESKLGAQQRHELIQRYLIQLPELYRAPILHRLDGGSNKSFAAALGIPEGTARRRLSEGIRRLERLIADARRTRPTYRTPPAVGPSARRRRDSPPT
ncbi:RNA polymerase sigma factor [Enhygromyxa salina]|uniref:RNA polymerase sigma factor n=1 Tax=Enhygromyxa salina TaxID=215803 RepID=UPI0015E63952|nr:sigma-70 family RNA polymerase sigma factor [Enhygromyxa salina]